ncbi:MAG: tRNA dihydrouridine synthase DusB [Clostridia bacterium]
MLAPMAEVTDLPFREICCAHGCDFTYTEMISAKGLHFLNKKTCSLLLTSSFEEPCGVQLFGSDPEIIAEAAKRLSEECFDKFALIDLNMGCPVKKIVNNGEGSALMKNPLLAAKIVELSVKSSRLPITVKFRKGFDDSHVNAVEFAHVLEESGVGAITVHPRTREQMYSGNADWDILAKVKARVKIPVIGNGDIFSGNDALNMIAQTGVDGIMIARGAKGNPFIFDEVKAAISGIPFHKISDKEILEEAKKHIRLHVKKKGEGAFIELRKHIAWYTKGMRNAAVLREKINSAGGSLEITEFLDWYADMLDKGLA